MSQLSRSMNAIQRRQTANDRFYTPDQVVAKAVSMIDYEPGEIWFEPFKGLGAYYNRFPVPEEQREWTEIDLGRDFFQYNGHVDIVCTNPPYSIINPVLDKLIQLRPRVIQLAIGLMNITIPRLRKMSSAGYVVTKQHWVDVRGWFGVTTIIQFERLSDKQFIENQALNKIGATSKHTLEIHGVTFEPNTVKQHMTDLNVNNA